MGVGVQSEGGSRLPPEGSRPGSPLFRFASAVAAFGARYHRAGLDGAEHLPDGPALLVANHGLYGLDTPVFFHLVREATGRLPVGLAERMMCRLQPMRRILEEIGGVEGTRDAAVSLLREGRLVVCYPGGAREVFKETRLRHRLRWERAIGFVHVAREAGVPIVPVAGVGVDDTYRVVTRLESLGRLAGHEKYAVPVSVGLGAAPWPARFRFRIGPPVEPPSSGSESAALEVKARLQRWIESRLEEAEDGGFDRFD